MRRAAKIDANQQNIVAALRKAGCSVAVTSNVGDGFPDLCVGRCNQVFLLEVKDGAKPPSARRLTPDQERFHAEWRGHVAVVLCAEDALREVGLM